MRRFLIIPFLVVCILAAVSPVFAAEGDTPSDIDIISGQLGTLSAQLEIMNENLYVLTCGVFIAAGVFLGWNCIREVLSIWMV